jgi:RNA polymerase-associated protein CTR9
MTKALSHCQKAAELKPADKAILHNIAMIQQKAAEIVLGLDPSKRLLQEVEQVIEQAESSTA